MTIYAYARVSTAKQKLERQLINLKTTAPTAVIYQEKFTGTNENRPQWQKLLNKVQAGDTIVFDSVSRMSRNSDEGTATYFELVDKGVNLEFIKEPHINTEVYSGAMDNANSIKDTGGAVDDILAGVRSYMRKVAEQQITIAFDQAEKEARDIKHRVIEGMAKSDKKGGAPVGNTYNKKAVPTDIIKTNYKGFGGTLNKSQLAKLLDVSRPTLNKWITDMEATA